MLKLSKGKPRSQEVRYKIRKTLLGVKHSLERNLKNSIASKGKSWTEARRLADKRRVQQFPG